MAMAMPTSAAASAGASLMPSPTIATTAWPPPGLELADDAALSAGSTSARTSAMPSRRATACALPRLSPLTSTDCARPCACSRARPPRHRA
jgi:hypothetical protein